MDSTVAGESEFEAEAVDPVVAALELAESWVGARAPVPADVLRLIVDEIGLPARRYRDFLDGLVARGHRPWRSDRSRH